MGEDTGKMIGKGLSNRCYKCRRRNVTHEWESEKSSKMILRICETCGARLIKFLGGKIRKIGNE
jgi:ribosomal protein S27E